MDDQDMKNKKDLLDALDDPGSLSQEELDAILDDPKELEDARLLGDYRQAFVRCHASLKPDVNKEWNNFRQSRISGKNKGKQLWIGISIGVAASVLLFFSWQMFNRTSLVPVNQPIVAFTASTQSQEVLLSTGDGRMVSYPHLKPTAYSRTGITRETRSWITSKRSGNRDTYIDNSQVWGLSTSFGRWNSSMVKCREPFEISQSLHRRAASG
ncbi:MAG: hypothetical protein ACLUDU_19900 [Butyricimonas faecihominis]